jgi:outer membrane protein
MKSLLMVVVLAFLTGKGLATPAPADATTLSLAQAREMALKAHPRMKMAELQTMIAQEGVKESRSAYLPLIAANATAVGVGEDVTRVAAGTLSNSQIYNRVGVGAVANMTLTDFGRTANLTEAARLRADAAAANQQVTKAQLLLEVDASYYAALEARAVMKVAAQTLSDRNVILERTKALATNALKSELDVQFASVAVDEARLLDDKAENDWQSALARLADLLGMRTSLTATLQEEAPALAELAPDSGPLQGAALAQRPDLIQQRFERDAARRLARAAQVARLPTISLVATAGEVPIGDAKHFERDFAAGGVNFNLPLFAGGLYRARQQEAELQARNLEAGLADAENNVVRDVRVAWLDSEHAREQIRLTTRLLASANSALSLAQARFDQGLSSMVELNQAELAQTSAAIAQVGAEYEYFVRRDILDYQVGSLH